MANRKTAATVVEKGVLLESRADTNEYQWMTEAIPVEVDTDLMVSYGIEVTRGKVGVGVLDFVGGKWIVTQDVVRPSDMMTFRAPSKQIQVILYGTGPPPTEATLLDLTIARR